MQKRNKARLVIAKGLIKSKADLDADDGYGGTALANAVYSGFEDLALYLINCGANVNTKVGVYIDGDSDITPLHRATGSPNLVAALIQAGAAVNAQDSSGETPLHWATRNRVIASMKLLLDAGADSSLKDSKGRAPIYWAGTYEYAPAEHRIFRLLKESKKDRHN